MRFDSGDCAYIITREQFEIFFNDLAAFSSDFKAGFDDIPLLGDLFEKLVVVTDVKPAGYMVTAVPSGFTLDRPVPRWMLSNRVTLTLVPPAKYLALSPVSAIIRMLQGEVMQDAKGDPCYYCIPASSFKREDPYVDKFNILEPPPPPVLSFDGLYRRYVQIPDGLYGATVVQMADKALKYV